MLVSELAQVKGSDFEAVDVSSLMVDADSGLAVQSAGRGGGSSNNGGSSGGSAGSEWRRWRRRLLYAQSFWGKNGASLFPRQTH